MDRSYRYYKPKKNAAEGATVKGATVYGAERLSEVIDFLNNVGQIAPHFVDVHEAMKAHSRYEDDFSEVKGQEHAKRAALISATGMHNLLLEGSPGCGKSMIAKRLRYILPPLHSDEILENAKLNALEGIEPDFTPVRPFRHPHHTSTPASIFGGGSTGARIGEVGLAHGGILFFDELPTEHWLRIPLSTHSTVKIVQPHWSLCEVEGRECSFRNSSWRCA